MTQRQVSTPIHPRGDEAVATAGGCEIAVKSGRLQALTSCIMYKSCNVHLNDSLILEFVLEFAGICYNDLVKQ